MRLGASRSAANTSLVGTATPGLTSTAGSCGRSSGSDSMSPMPRMIARAGIEAHRHVGAGDPRRPPGAVDRRARCGWRAPAAATPPRHRTSRRRGRPRPAAASTARNGRACRPSTRSASARAALSTRLSSSRAGGRGGRAAHASAQARAPARRSARRRRRRTPPGFRARDSRRRAGRARAASG